MFLIFDLDGTLAKPGESASPETVRLLHELRGMGARIVLSSGKPTFYLCGFARQLGIEDAVLIGENGGVIQEGVGLPPAFFRKADLPQKTKDALKALREEMEKAFPDRIWFQPNETELTPFPFYPEDFPPIRQMIRRHLTSDLELSFYEHPDGFDIAWSRLSKGEGVRFLSRITGTPTREMISVGDWTNDYSMFAETGYSVGISLPDPEKAAVNFPTIEDALRHLLQKLRNEKDVI